MTYDVNNKQQEMAYQLIKDTNVSFFLTGKAGTGKTTFLKKIQEEINKNFIVLAPTGIAAINAGGDTIHSFFGLPFSVITFKEVGKVRSAKIELLRNVDTLIIDEVSMCRADLIDAIDRTLKHICHSGLPFGGKQVVFVGDIYQLPPVVKAEDQEILYDMYGEGIPFFFKAKAFRGKNLPTIEFQKVYRQEDAKFLSTLNRIRNGICLQEDLDQLNSRMQECNDKYVITLSSVNAEADKLNKEELDKLDTPAFTYEALIEKEFNEKKISCKEKSDLESGCPGHDVQK